MASKVELCDVLTDNELTRDKLNIPCPAKACKSIAMKLDKWEPLACIHDLDCTVIRENHKGDYASQRLMSLTKWKEQLGSKATYLMLAEGLENIGRLDLVEYLCVLYKDTIASQDADNLKALTIGPEGINVIIFYVNILIQYDLHTRGQTAGGNRGEKASKGRSEKRAECSAGKGNTTESVCIIYNFNS